MDNDLGRSIVGGGMFILLSVTFFLLVYGALS